MSTSTENGSPRWSVRTTDEGLRLLLIAPSIAVKREHLHIALTTIGSYVKQNSPHDARVLDFMATSKVWRQRLKHTLDDYRPDLVGIYISTPYFPAAQEVAAEVRRIAPGTPLLAGGHHATLAPEEVIEAQAFDMLIVGEGEKPVVTLLDTLSTEGELSQVPGLWWRVGDEVRQVPKQELLEAEGFPSLDWSIVDPETLEANFYFWGILPVMASRGCPHRCSFCSVTNIQRLYPGEQFIRHRDPIAVVDEIEADLERYAELGLRVAYFYDLNFLMDLRWLKAFTDEYKRRGMNRRLPWSAYTRADHVRPAVLECLRDSGCVNLRIGIESGNREQRNALYSKDLDDETLARALAGVKAEGISVTGYFMIGSPGERPEWMRDSLDFVKRHGVEYPVFLLFQPVAGADVLEHAEALGSEVSDDRSTRTADLLHGVRMRHKHVARWQLHAFLLLTHFLFGTRLVWRQFWRDGWRYLPRMAVYMLRATRSGFTLFGAFTYYVYYGFDHPFDQIAVPAVEHPGWGWRVVRAFTRLWLPDSGEPPLGNLAGPESAGLYEGDGEIPCTDGPAALTSSAESP